MQRHLRQELYRHRPVLLGKIESRGRKLFNYVFVCSDLHNAADLTLSPVYPALDSHDATRVPEMNACNSV